MIGFSEALRTIRTQKGVTAAILLQLILTTCIGALMLLHLSNAVSTSLIPAAEQDSGQELYLFGNPESSDYQFYFSNPSRLRDLKAFYRTLSTHSGYLYLERNSQPLQVADFLGTDAFCALKGSGERRTYSDSGKIYTSVNAYALNLQAAERDRLTLSEGRLFTQEEMVLRDGALPILLGSAYTEFYSLGDILLGEYYTIPIRFQVVGFLERGCETQYRGIPKVLDHCVVFPSFEVEEPPSDEEGFFAQGLLYSRKLGQCSILPDQELTYPQLVLMLERWRAVYNIHELSFLRKNEVELELLKLAAYTDPATLLGIGILMLLFLFFTLIHSLLEQVRRCRYRYGVYRSCGISLDFIRNAIFLELLLYWLSGAALSLSLILVFMASALRCGMALLLLQLPAFCLAWFLSVRQLQKMDLVKEIKYHGIR